MKKMYNTKMTKKARIGIAALAGIMAMSLATPLAVNASTLKGPEIRLATDAEKALKEAEEDLARKAKENSEQQENLIPEIPVFFNSPGMIEFE